MGDPKKIRKLKKELAKTIDPIVDNASALTEVMDSLHGRAIKKTMMDEMEGCVLLFVRFSRKQ
jgi:hypothetical protein